MRVVEIVPATDGRRVETCGDCGATEGELHELNCEYERCPFCAGQLASCDCVYEKLNLVDKNKFSEETCWLPPDIYEEGLAEDLEERWTEVLESEGRVPFILYPNICEKCGATNPELFRLPDEEWEKYVQMDMRSSIFCKSCFAYIKYVITQHERDA